MAGHRALLTGCEQSKDSCQPIPTQHSTGEFNQLNQTRERNKSINIRTKEMSLFTNDKIIYVKNNTNFRINK